MCLFLYFLRQALIERGADVKAKTEDGKTASDIARTTNFPNIADVLDVAAAAATTTEPGAAEPAAAEPPAA